MIDVLTNFIVIILQYIHVANHHVIVKLKLTQCSVKVTEEATKKMLLIGNTATLIKLFPNLIVNLNN